jgi:hypothetical protein
MFILLLFREDSVAEGNNQREVVFEILTKDPQYHSDAKRFFSSCERILKQCYPAFRETDYSSVVQFKAMLYSFVMLRSGQIKQIEVDLSEDDDQLTIQVNFKTGKVIVSGRSDTITQASRDVENLIQEFAETKVETKINCVSGQLKALKKLLSNKGIHLYQIG